MTTGKKYRQIMTQKQLAKFQCLASKWKVSLKITVPVIEQPISDNRVILMTNYKNSLFLINFH